ncbi:MAG: citrate synthase [Lachnospiraceae bacterium]
MNALTKQAASFSESMIPQCLENAAMDPTLFDTYGVKRGLRDKAGNGVVAGLTNISDVSAYWFDEQGNKHPRKAFYRGYISTILSMAFTEKRFGFEETTPLPSILKLPDEKNWQIYKLLASLRRLPTNFVRDVIMKASGKDIMNSMTRSVLTLGSYDDTLNDTSLSNVLRQCLMLISEFPMLAVYGYRAYSHYERNKSLYIHRPDMSLSTAENILRMLRPDKKFTKLEALVLDIALVLHMEHGGGNNSTFTTRVVTSSGSDTYSVMAAALCSLKGPKHGGANIKVQQMMKDLKKHVKDTSDVDEIVFYLSQLLNKEAFDKKGLIYGMGHAVYSVSDPRAQIFKGFVKDLAEEKGLMDDYQLYSNVEQLAVDLISKRRTIYKGVCANVDFYSGFVYSMLGIPEELFTPLFAMARIVGWSAHRMEELITGDKIIRPAKP